MSEDIGLLYDACGSWEDDGFHLTFRTDEGDGHLRVPDVTAARSLIDAVKELEPWVRDHDYHRAAYDRATTAERAEVLNVGDKFAYHEDGWDPSDGCAPDDPKSCGYHDRHAAFYDDRDKGEVGP